MKPPPCTCGHLAPDHTILAGCIETTPGKGYCLCGKYVAALAEPSPAKAHDGVTYDPAVDAVPLNRQQQAVYTLMSDGHWRTLADVAARLEYPEASISARLRDLRKAKWGGHTVERRRQVRLSDYQSRTWEYRLIVVKAA